MYTGQGVVTGLVLLVKMEHEWGGANNGTWAGGSVLLNCEEAWDTWGACCVVVIRSLIVGAMLGVAQFQCD
jgi:hypothetical protein